MSKFERLARMLKIITLIKSNPNLTRSELASLCEVDSVRTIQRDINSLLAAGVPIYWSGKGYKIMPGFFLPPTALSFEEALSLLLSAKAFAEGIGSFHKNTIESAISKIIATLPSSVVELFNNILNHINVENRQYSDPGQFLSKINKAISENMQLRIKYYSFNRRSITERVVDPYGLVFRRHAWYLIAYCHERNNILTFRVSRIHDLKYTGKTFEMPKDFSIDNYMGKSWQIMKGEETEVSIKFDPEVAPLIKEVNWHPTQQIEDLPDGSIIFKATVEGTTEIGTWVLSYGYHAEVLSPREFRSRIAEIAKKMHSLYNDEELQVQASLGKGESQNSGS